ncbi:MAG: uracil phosphoribosyltransferase [Deltaproteobacteria bacterium]|nr:MAG: uracil phosphoribosyltransferase [Deltaproteobacteria bacterium]
MKDITYLDIPRFIPEFSHRYGENVHLLASPVLLSLLARLGSPETVQPAITQLVERLYTHLLRAVLDIEFPRKSVRIPTRMKELHPQEGFYEGEIIDPDTPCVVVSLARAGVIPSQHCYMELSDLLSPERVRQDFILMNRVTNEANEVIGAKIAGFKIGGGIEDAIVLIPDPMGATGGSLCRVLDLYAQEFPGTPKRWVAMNLIVTPEYLHRIRSEHPEVVVYALRLDRGLSDAHVLQSIPGTYPEGERGLNDHQYIVPGAGGLGEVFNNSFV